MNLPMIDIGSWRRGTPDERVSIAAEVDQALRTSGFLLAVNHGVSAQLAAEVRNEARAFFALPDSVKEQYRTRVGGRGWIPPGAESNSSASGVEAPPDMKETFKVGYFQESSPMRNVWPAEIPELRMFVAAYLDDVWALALDFFEIFNAALGLTPGSLAAHACAEASSVNLNWYPSLDALGAPRPGQFRIGAHSDFGVLTILDRQVGYGGLQIQTLDGEWVDAPHVAGALTINIGDMLAHWTGDRWRSTRHRVLPPSEEDAGEELLSIVAFCGISPDTMLETLVPGAPETYEPVLAGDYLRAKLEAIDVA